MKLNCLIIDDEPYARKGLAEYISDVNFLALKAEASNPVNAIALIEEHKIDLIFLDIQMPKINGFEFLKSNGKLPLVILTTAYENYAIEAFDYSVVDYLLKPISFHRFLKAAQKAFEIQMSAFNAIKPSGLKDDYIIVKSNGKFLKLELDKITYIEGLENYINIYTSEGKTIVYVTLKSMESSVPGDQFVRIHKSFIVNLNNISSFSRTEIFLDNNKVLPLGKVFYDAVYSKLTTNKIIKR